MNEAELDSLAYELDVREQHEATHGESEMCGADCIALGLADFDDCTCNFCLTGERDGLGHDDGPTTQPSPHAWCESCGYAHPTDDPDCIDNGWTGSDGDLATRHDRAPEPPL